MMTCQETIEKLHAYLDRELTEAERREVDVHLGRCTDCTHAFHFERGVLHFVGHHCRKTIATASLHQRVRVSIAQVAQITVRDETGDR